MDQPVSHELIKQLDSLTPVQLAWLSGYSWARSQEGSGASAPPAAGQLAAAAPAATPSRSITVFSASQTGNARRVAEQLHEQLTQAGLNPNLVSAGDFKSKNIDSLSIVLFVISTQGEGDPPEEAVPLFKFLTGKKAPNLKDMSYAVLSLGDSSYTGSFCKAGSDLDEILSGLGAQQLLDRVDCDLEFEKPAQAWRDSVAQTLSSMTEQINAASTAAAPSDTTVASAASNKYSKESPFEASVLLRQKLTSDEALKDVEHIEIDLEGSDLVYQPGDSLGVYYHNSADLVDEILQHTQIDAQAKVKLDNGQEVTIKEALTDHLDITQNTPSFVKSYAQYSEHTGLQEMIEELTEVNDYVNNNPPVRVFADFAGTLDAQQLHDLFRPLAPRLYSIASSQAEVGDEVHLTLGVVRFENNEKTYLGGASGYLGERIQEDDTLRVFIEENKNFRLPSNGDTPVIMIGAGTGVAPYRAFMQQRENNGDTGPNWLIFGNQNFLHDFLYQTEWLQYRKNGLLNKYDFAWSRDGTQKVYVQHKLAEKGAELWQWIQDGAHIYVCGDATRMAKDVDHTLLEVIAQHGHMNMDDADEYLSEMREDKRYQRDVY